MKNKKSTKRAELKLQTLAGTYYPTPKGKRGTTKPVAEIPTTVDLIAKGYEWICPSCQEYNETIEAVYLVACHKCKKQYTVSTVESAYK